MSLFQMLLADATPAIPYDVVMETTEAVTGSPEYFADYDNTTYNTGLTTVGSATDSGTLAVAVSNDVLVNVTRTGVTLDVTDINFFLNGASYAAGVYDVNLTAGNVVNVTATFDYADITPGDEIKVTIVEG